MRRKDKEVTDRAELEAIIRRCRVCQLAMADGGEPYVVPLSFGFELADGALTLYFHSAPEGRKLDFLRRNPRVCFSLFREGGLLEGETACEASSAYESVIGRGTAEFLEDPADKCRALTQLMWHQTGQGYPFTPEQAHAVCVFCVRAAEFTGKRQPAPRMADAT